MGDPRDHDRVPDPLRHANLDLLAIQAGQS